MRLSAASKSVSLHFPLLNWTAENRVVQPCFSLLYSFSKHGRCWRTLQAVWNPCRCERESRRGELENISNQISMADSITWKLSQTVYFHFMQTYNERNYSQLLFLTARGCVFVDFGCCKGITGWKTTGITVYNKVLQVLPQVTRKCYWCHVRLMWRWR